MDDERFKAMRDLLRDIAAPNMAAVVIDLAAGRVHAAMAALVAARRSGALKARRENIAWTTQERSVVDGLRRLAAAGKSRNVQRWQKAWSELPGRAVEFLVAEAGGYGEFAKLPWLIASRPFGIPGPEGVIPLLGPAIERTSAKGRPPEVLRDLAALAILRAAAVVQGHPDEPPPAWSQPTSPFRVLLAAIEKVYAALPPEETQGRLPIAERAHRHAAGLDRSAPHRSALRIDSTATLTRLVAEAFPRRSA
ncbi:hypothetical protein V5F40_09060 [Xanthobacter sp. DSM 14520]|uniref:hypothetical protein n=1 Tax=Xanthobacter autotrophicus (strain ATCC BAA-1158 / Py2) TaxID=78245 RepID=UPI003729E860